MSSRDLESEDLSGLDEVIDAFARCKNVEAAKRCLRIFVRHARDGAPIIVFGWAPNFPN